MKRTAARAIGVLALFTFFIISVPVHAAVSSWQKGANIVPQSQTDFSSETFKQSLRNLKATGANYVALVVPYYQSNTQSSDIGAGWNTPTDASLISAIDYAHSIGLAVALKVHNESYTGDWRAYINPSDRNAWFSNLNSKLINLGQIGKAHNVEMIVMGVEMVSVASSQVNSNNTQRWQTLISNLRQVYPGKLTYDANSTNNNNSAFENEKKSIGFWSALDYVSLSVYYNLNGDNSVQSLMSQWDYWNSNDIRSFQQSVNKPILFGEIGYRSVDGAHQAPWDSGKPGNYNPTEQVNAYDALMRYWNGYSYVAGVFWWDWSSNPSAGMNGDKGYTPQNKPAEQTLTQWFTSAPNPGGGGTPALTSGATASPSNPNANSQVVLSAQVRNTGGPLSFANVDIEVYDSAGNQVFQKFYANESINTNETKTYSAQWGGGAPGTYKVAIGVFNNDWSKNYSWNGNAATIVVGGSTPPPNNPPPNNPPPTSTSTPTGNYTTNIWWPTNGSTVTGTQPFKSNLDGLDVSQYVMYWQVDGGMLNLMSNNAEDYPHKQADVNVSGWHWNPTNKYTINFVSKNANGTVISQKSTQITVQ